eukprot:Gb_24928 [translate_table: standard]
MELAQPLRNQKKNMVSFVGLVFQLKRRKITTSEIKREENDEYSAGQDVRMLCTENRLKEALEILYVMDQHIDDCTYACLLQACINKKALPEGKLIQAHLTERGFILGRFLGNTLVNMYSKCGSLLNARRVFDHMSERDVVSWTAMISAYARNGQVEEALTLFYQMQPAGIQPNQFTYATVLPACAHLGALQQGMEIHEEIIKSGFHSDFFVGNALVDMYAKCERIELARDIFDKMSQRNVVSWTSIIAGYAQNSHAEEALKLFRQMQLAGVKPNSQTLATVLPSLGNMAALDQGMELHEEIIRSGFLSDIFVGNALVDMYAKCGSIEYARNIFDKMHQRDVISWTAMIAGYAQNGYVEEALKLFRKMPERNVVSWTALIAGYAQNGSSEEALTIFRQMQLACVKPNSKTFASVLPACATMAALEQGKEIHEVVIRTGFESDVFVGSALIDMYAKCGSIGNARYLFDKMPLQNVVSWTAMIAGYAMHGCGTEALKLFEKMQHSGTNPNSITLVGVLSACCHAGLVDEGRQYFDCMREYYHITPAMEHYGCMVDLLGRAGRLDEAHDFINKMPIKPDATVWVCLLGACTIHKNVGLGECVAERLFELDPKNAVPYVLLSNIYAAAGRWDGIEKVRKIMKGRRVNKTPGCSWIEVDKQVYYFHVGDRSHPQAQEIYAKLERLSRQMNTAGYVPDTRFLLDDVDEEQQE